MNLIVCVDNNWGIGKDNKLLFNLPEDLNYFKLMTLHRVVVMGYNTLLSLPNSKPLKDRTNIVLAPEDVSRDDCIVVHNLKDLFKTLNNYDQDDIFIIGGGMFYNTMYPYCENAYVTKVDSDGGATVFFENLDNLPNWQKSMLFPVREDKGLTYQFLLYENSQPKKFE